MKKELVREIKLNEKTTVRVIINVYTKNKKTGKVMTWEKKQQ